MLFDKSGMVPSVLTAQPSLLVKAVPEIDKQLELSPKTASVCEKLASPPVNVTVLLA